MDRGGEIYEASNSLRRVDISLVWGTTQGWTCSLCHSQGLRTTKRPSARSLSAKRKRRKWTELSYKYTTLRAAAATQLAIARRPPERKPVGAEQLFLVKYTP
ncbi:hypothetical protein CRG98_041861, partial [Punica granatum]